MAKGLILKNGAFAEATASDTLDAPGGVRSNSLDALSAGALSIGTSTATGITLGKSGLTVNVPGTLQQGGLNVAVQKSMYGGTTYDSGVDLNTLSTVFETRFLSSPANAPSGLTGEVYYLGGPGGDVSQRGVQVIWTPGGGHYFRVHNDDVWHKIWNDGNDGTGSGLDADLFAGLSNGYYAQWATSGTFTQPITFSGGISSIGAYLPSTTDTLANVTPVHMTLVGTNGRDAVLDTISALGGEGDWFYCADVNPAFTITSNMGTGISNLFNADMSADALIPIASISSTTPWVLEISKSGTITATDVLSLWFIGHDLSDNGATFTDWQVETVNSDGTYSIVLNRTSVSDKIDRLAVPLHLTSATYPDGTTNYHYIRGIRLTVRGATAVNYDTANLRFAAIQLRDHRPSFTPANGIGALDMRGGSLYGTLNAVSGNIQVAGSNVWTAATLTNLNQLTNGPGYITGITSGNVTGALGYTPSQSASGGTNSIVAKDSHNTLFGPADRNAGLFVDFIANATDGLSDGGTYHGVLTFRQYGAGTTDLSGGKTHQLAQTDNGNLWTRASTSTTAWDTWYKIWHSGNLTTVSQLTNDAGYLTGNQSITLSGDATGSGTTSIAVTLANTGVTAGTYPKVTVNAKGLVTGSSSLAAADIPNLDWSKITTGKPTTLAGYGITDGASLGTATPLMDGTASAGSGATASKVDHVHPTDTSRAPTASPTFTGTVTLSAADSSGALSIGTTTATSVLIGHSSMTGTISLNRLTYANYGLILQGGSLDLYAGSVTANTFDVHTANGAWNLGTTNAGEITIGRTGYGFNINAQTQFWNNAVLEPNANATVNTTTVSSNALLTYYSYWNGTGAVSSPGYTLRTDPSSAAAGTGDLVFLDAGTTEKLRLKAGSGNLSMGSSSKLLTFNIDTPGSGYLNIGATASGAIKLGNASGGDTEILGLLTADGDANVTGTLSADVVQSTSGGFVFPDGTKQTSAVNSSISTQFQQGVARHGDVITFGSPFGTTPKIMIWGGADSEPGNYWGATGNGTETGAYNSSAPVYDDFAALNASNTGFTVQARLRQSFGTSSQVSQSINAAVANNSLTAVGQTANTNSFSPGPSSDGTYTFYFNGSMSVPAPGGTSMNPYTSGADLYVAIEYALNGSTWTTYQTNHYTCSAYHLNTGHTTINEAVAMTVSGVTTSTQFRIRVTSYTDDKQDLNGVDLGSAGGSFTLHVFSTANGDPNGAVTYTTTATGSTTQFASKTRNSGDKVYWMAVGQSTAVGNGSSSTFARAGKSTDQTVPSSTATILNYDNVLTDTDTAITTGASWKYTVPTGKDGVYIVSFGAVFPSLTATTGEAYVDLYVNGTFYARSGVDNPTGSSGTSWRGINSSVMMNLSAGDYFYLQAWQSSGNTVTVKANNTDNWINVVRVGAVGWSVATGQSGAWVAPTYQNGWTDFGSPYATGGYYKDASGFVHFKGLLKNATVPADNTVMFTLPVGYRPKENHLFVAYNNGGSMARLDLDSAGNVYFRTGGTGTVATAYYSIENISFLAEQ